MRGSILTNARVLTMDPACPVVQALGYRDGRVVAIGSCSEVTAVVDSNAKLTDLADRTVVPGFNDCHMHILPYGLDLAKADLSPAAGVTDVPSLVHALRAWCDENLTSEWALGGRYDQNTFPGAAHPTRHELDAAFPDRPVFVMQTSKHAGAANTVALRLAGVARDMPDPEGGEIVRDAAGEPTGVVLESAMGLISRHIPRSSRSELVAAIKRANGALLREGITSASDLNTGWLDMETEIACYRQAAEEGAPVRTTLCPHAPCFGGPDSIPLREEFARSFQPRPNAAAVRLGPIKLFSDGALTVRTAALREPYVDGAGRGMLLHEPDELRAYIMAAHRAGWQIAVHAIGDRAIELVLDCYAAAQAILPRLDARHRIEHAMLLDEALIRRFAEQRVIPVVQPEFVARLGDAYVMGLGPERAARLNPTASLQRACIGVPFSSDCPIVPGAPLDGIRSAAERTTRSGAALGVGESISPLDGLRNYTYWASYATFDEGETGALKTGMRADLAILDGEIECGTARVAATIADGEVVYSR